ncbi:MAG: NUDIX hydrolase [Nanoarchaeota archaeon]|nr:NUDIX hydrolase [Nanoarchaeota archaeon]
MSEEKIRKQFIIVKSLVINDKGEVLFVRRKKEDLKQAHNKWEFPGGKIDFGESPEQTAIREAKEESNYDVKIDYLLTKILSSKWESPEREAQQILICYVCTLVGGESALGDHGVSEIKWFKVNNAPKDQDCLPGTIDFLNLYKKTVEQK